MTAPEEFHESTASHLNAARPDHEDAAARPESVRSRTVVLAVALVLIAVAVRVWAVGYARFTGDESYFWATARNIATLRAAPVYGPQLTSSSAYHPGPIFYYLMALPQLLGVSPRLGGTFVALLHGLAGWLLFLIARRCSGGRAAIAALVLFSFAPWDVLYADRVWLSCVAPVWGTVTLYAALNARTSVRWQGVFVFFALVLPQLHMSAPIVWILCGVLFATDRPERIGKRAIALGVGGAIVAYLPPIYWEATHGFENTIAIVTKGGGAIAATEVLATPLRVFGYAILYATGEIGYHFARGYWVPFSEASYYGTVAGLRSWLELHGPLSSVAILSSLALSVAAWAVATWRLGRKLLERSRGAANGLDLAERFHLGVIAALIGGALLMMSSRKPYFPHYTNLLMPTLLLAPAVFLELLFCSRRCWRFVGVGLLLLASAGMASSSIRYYRSVDALNGLDPTVAMVDRAAEEPGPIALEFEGFPNEFAWQMLASVKHSRALDLSPNAAVRYRVKNRTPHRGDLPKDAERYGVIVLERFVGSSR